MDLYAGATQRLGNRCTRLSHTQSLRHTFVSHNENQSKTRNVLLSTADLQSGIRLHLGHRSELQALQWRLSTDPRASQPGSAGARLMSPLRCHGSALLPRCWMNQSVRSPNEFSRGVSFRGVARCAPVRSTSNDRPVLPHRALVDRGVCGIVVRHGLVDVHHRDVSCHLSQEHRSVLGEAARGTQP